MAVENWVDEICNLAGEVSDGIRPPVKSYSVYSGKTTPESINTFPAAITYVENLVSNYSLGGPLLDFWSGVTEFHLFPNKALSNYPAAIRYFALIRNAFAAHMQLNNKVAFCQLKQDETGLALAVFSPGTDSEHLGIIARWIVKENVTGDFTVSQ
jgi:hypothetical protein